MPGPNRWRIVRTEDPDPADYGYPLRRALFIRSELKLKKHEKLQTDAGLARALLLASDHQHGARSLEKLVVPLNVKTGRCGVAKASDAKAPGCEGTERERIVGACGAQHRAACRGRA
jgi:hypothetical protein